MGIRMTWALPCALALVVACGSKATDTGAGSSGALTDAASTSATGSGGASQSATTSTSTMSTTTSTGMGGGGGATTATGTGGGMPTMFTVGGTVSGLKGSLKLQNNGGDDLTVMADGKFTFKTALADQALYQVKITGEPGVQ